MKIKDEALKAEMRASPVCHYCGRPTPSGCDAAHVLSRGAGGSDIRSNLIALCRGFYKREGFVSCHQRNHSMFRGARIRAKDLWRKIAERDGRTPEEVEAEVFYVRQLPKGSTWPAETSTGPLPSNEKKPLPTPTKKSPV